MIASLRRILIGVLLVGPVVAAISSGLLFAPKVVSLVVALVGVAGLMAAETLHSKFAAAVGGVLAMAGLLAWALLEARLVGAAG
jgi:hypothetical protein